MIKITEKQLRLIIREEYVKFLHKQMDLVENSAKTTKVIKKGK